MKPGMTVELLSLGFGVALAFIGLVVWAVRLEGKVAANATAIQTLAGTTNTAVAALQARANGHDETKIEVVRLQEQIKHLTELIEKWLQPPPPSPRRSRASKGDGA